MPLIVVVEPDKLLEHSVNTHGVVQDGLHQGTVVCAAVHHRCYMPLIIVTEPDQLLERSINSHGVVQDGLLKGTVVCAAVHHRW